MAPYFKESEKTKKQARGPAKRVIAERYKKSLAFVGQEGHIEYCEMVGNRYVYCC